MSIYNSKNCSLFNFQNVNKFCSKLFKQYILLKCIVKTTSQICLHCFNKKRQEKVAKEKPKGYWIKIHEGQFLPSVSEVIAYTLNIRAVPEVANIL